MTLESLFKKKHRSRQKSRATIAQGELGPKKPVEAQTANEYKFGIIGDFELIAGFRLAGIGFSKGGFKNCLLVDKETTLETLTNFFLEVYARHDIGVIFVDFHSARLLHTTINRCTNDLPIVIILPSKTTMAQYLEHKRRMRRLKATEAEY